MTSEFLDKAEQAILAVLDEVKPELMAAYGSVEFDTKLDKTVVTHLDKSVETRLRETLKKLDSGIGIVGEEFGAEGNPDTYWLVDPIDGTESFIRGLPLCRNLLALIEDGVTTWAMANYFARDELWTARKGEGTYCDGRRVTMRYRPLNRAWIEIGGAFSSKENALLFSELRKHIAGYAMMHDFTNVISGKVDGVVSVGSGGGEWDYAPRALLYTEAGARIANIGSDKYDVNIKNFVVAHKDNFDELKRLVEAGL